MTNPDPFLPLNPLQPAPLTRRDRQPLKSEFLAVKRKRLKRLRWTTSMLCKLRQ